MLVQAWSPLRKARSGSARAACEQIGAKYGKSAAQVGLRYIADTGACFTTQTKSRSHFEEDLDIFDFQLSPAEVAQLAAAIDVTGIQDAIGSQVDVAATLANLSYADSVDALAPLPNGAPPRFTARVATLESAEEALEEVFALYSKYLWATHT